jgi:hypothetical protein
MRVYSKGKVAQSMREQREMKYRRRCRKCSKVTDRIQHTHGSTPPTRPVRHVQAITSRPTCPIQQSSPRSSSLTSPLHSQESKVASHNGSSKEVWAREATVFLRFVQIGERSVRSRFVQPFGYTLENFGASLGRCNGSSLELPIRLCVQVARVEGELLTCQ